MKTNAKQAIKSRSSQIWALVAGVVQLVVGVLLLIDASGFTSLIVTAFGAFLVVMGVVNAVRYFRTPVMQAVVSQDLTRALSLLLLGGFCLFQFKWIADAMPLMSMVYGVGIVIGGILRSQWSVDMLRLRRQYWFVPGLGALVAYVLGAVVLANPFAQAHAMWICIAVTLIACAVVDVAGGVLGGKPKPLASAQVGASGAQAGLAAAEAPAAAEDVLAKDAPAQEPEVVDAVYEEVAEPQPQPVEAPETPVDPPAPNPADEPVPAQPAIEPDELEPPAEQRA